MELLLDPRKSLRLISLGAVEETPTPRFAPPGARRDELRPVTPMASGDCEVVPEWRTADALDRLSVQRVAEIRHRLDKGLYASPLVAQEVANRLMESGDI